MENGWLDNAAYGLGHSFWATFQSVLEEVAWEQALSAAVLMGVLALLNFAIRKEFQFLVVVSISIAGSFFLWPHITLIYFHFTRPETYNKITMFHDFSGNPRVLGHLFAILIIVPLLANQLSLFLLLLVVPLAALANWSHLLYLRWLGYVGLFALLPVGWFLDRFNQSIR